MTDPMSDPTTNARFQNLGGGTFSELMADQVQFFYDPTTQEARAIFNGLPYLNFGTTAAPLYRALGSSHDILQVDLSDKMLQCYGSGFDPVTGAPLANISNAGMMTILKQFYDFSVNDRATKLAAAALAAQQAADAAAAATAALSTAKALLASATPSPALDGTAASYTAAINGLTVTFTDTTVPAANVTLTGWTWIFGDAVGSSTNQNPIYTYPYAGTFEVALVVVDPNGETIFVTTYVTVVAPASA